MRSDRRRDTYPRTLRGVSSCACVACDGTWMGPFTVLVAAAGAWTESEWLEIQEARCNPLPAKRQHGAAGDCPPAGSRCDGAGSGNGAGRKPKRCSRGTNRRRGCRKATQGTRAGSQGARRGSQGGATGAFRAGWYRPQGCRRGTRVPVAPPAARRGRTARAVGRGEPTITHEIFSNQAFLFRI